MRGLSLLGSGRHLSNIAIPALAYLHKLGIHPGANARRVDNERILRSNIPRLSKPLHEHVLQPKLAVEIERRILAAFPVLAICLTKAASIAINAVADASKVDPEKGARVIH